MRPLVFVEFDYNPSVDEYKSYKTQIALRLEDIKRVAGNTDETTIIWFGNDIEDWTIVEHSFGEVMTRIQEASRVWGRKE